MSQNITAEQKGETTVYTACRGENCGAQSQCVLKAHIKNGVVVAVEPDDRYNTGIGREDEVLSEQDLLKVRLQRRPCPRGLVAHKYLYHPDRILYPLKRAPSSRRGDGKYVRISWDEALTTIANKMKEIRERYGPYSIMVPFSYTSNKVGLGRLFSFWGAGVDSWGWSSYDSNRLASHIMTGVGGWELHHYVSSSASDMLANSRLIVIWGSDPTLGSSGPGYQFSWFVKLARERGKPVIIIDPRYTIAAEVLADQWIPIKPGTDTAMFVAMAHVLFKEDLWDKGFVAKHVEPVGFEKWRNYILGVDDGIEKTPEWAERECAVPAETIRELTRLVATSRPAWLWCNWGVNRKSRGEQTARTFAALQAILGYWGVPGAGPPLNLGPTRDVQVEASWGSPPGTYDIPRMYRGHYWAQAVLLLDKVRSGELSEAEYIRMVGYRADPSLLKDFNPKMLFEGARKSYDPNFLVTSTDSPNYQIRALERMEFIVAMNSMMTPTVRYADVVLPARDWMWEEKYVNRTSLGGFEAITYCPGVVEPPGEVKSYVWVHTKLAEKLGVDPKKFFKYYTTDENWDRDWERYMKDCYQCVVDYYQKRKINIPSWEEFTRGKFINCDELDDRPFVGWDEQIREGKPFKTESGKIEFYSNYIANEANRGKGELLDPFGRVYEVLPGDWGDLTPMPTYQTAVRGMNDALAKDYPLMLLSPHARYRNHSAFWNHPWLRDNVYRHRVWISPADAKARGIKDDDMVKIYNDRGTAVMPAYVTSRIMPGIVVIHHGAWYTPDESGIDFGASPSTLLGGDFGSCTTPAKATTIVQMEKYGGR